MRFIHLADLHLGKVVSDFPMTEDQRHFLWQIVDTVREERIDAVLISGDVYDRTIPPESAVRLLDDFICEIRQTGAKLLMITGNHDSDERLSFGSRLFEERGVYIRTRLEEKITPVKLEDEYGEVNFYLLPFIKASQVRSLYGEDYESYDAAVRAVISQMNIDPAARNVILAHQFVVGSRSAADEATPESQPAGEAEATGALRSDDDGRRPVGEAADERTMNEGVYGDDGLGANGVAGIMLGGSESYITRHVGLVEQIQADCFDSFDYAALGHIHRAQNVGRETVRYAGAPLKYHFDEIGQIKSVPVITMKSKGEVEVELRQFKPLRDMRGIKGPAAKLLAPENVRDTQDYIFVTLTDKDVLPDAINIFRKTYPNVMQIRYDNSHTKDLEAVDLTDHGQERSFSETVSDFYRLIYNEEMSDEELEIMRKAARSAGIATDGED
ncbi:MAG: exonuclease SbcCD subunit D [Lachnospiraceae bacterium]|nr:exonuclease SbcCD subunit D [Lachnospiraceae bacterium]